jgi:hypothetical protein
LRPLSPNLAILDPVVTVAVDVVVVTAPVVVAVPLPVAVAPGPAVIAGIVETPPPRPVVGPPGPPGPGALETAPVSLGLRNFEKIFRTNIS